MPGDDGTTTPPGPVALRFRLLDAAGGRFGLLLVALVSLMALTPLILEGPVGTPLLSTLTGLLLVAALHAAQPGGRPVVVGIGLALTDVVLGRCAVYFDVRALVVLQTLFWLATLVYVTTTILQSVFASDEASLETLMASLCVYLLIGLIGAFGFALTEFLFPGSFEPLVGEAGAWTDDRLRATIFMKLFVFSLSALSGSGFAEVQPATDFAANAASLEAMMGQIYLAVIVARLVGLQTGASRGGDRR